MHGTINIKSIGYSVHNHFQDKQNPYYSSRLLFVWRGIPEETANYAVYRIE